MPADRSSDLREFVRKLGLGNWKMAGLLECVRHYMG